MLAHANLILTARQDGRLVGFARSLTDFCFCCYLSDLAVDKACQGQGIGKRLIEETRKRLGRAFYFHQVDLASHIHSKRRNHALPSTGPNRLGGKTQSPQHLRYRTRRRF